MIRLILIAIVCTALLIPIAAVTSRIISSQPTLIAISFGLAYIVAPAVLLQIWPARRGKKSKSIGNALWDGELLTVDYPVSAVAQIEEMEDEGLHFLVAIDNVGTLWLSGQYLYGPVKRGEFPSQGIRLFRNKATGAFYGIEATGQRLEQWVKYDPVQGEPTEAGFELEDSKVYSQSIEKIAAALRNSPRHQKRKPYAVHSTGLHLRDFSKKNAACRKRCSTRRVNAAAVLREEKHPPLMQRRR